MNEGEEIGRDCPKCETPLIFEKGFMDCWNEQNGHSTTELRIAVCPKCKEELEDE